MSKFHRKIQIVSLATGLFVGCAPSPSQMQKLLEDHPEILTSAIEKNPEKILMSIQAAAKAAEKAMRDKSGQEEVERLNKEMANPLKPTLPEDRAYRGVSGAPITIVAYSDFQCPFCKRGFAVIEQVLKEYDGKVRYLHKNLPLPMHPMAMPAAKRFEAIAMQDAKKAFQFHDALFNNQNQLYNDGEKYMDGLAKKLGVNVAKMKTDMESSTVANRIKSDSAEAQQYGISGTPGYIVNGVSIRGAYPLENFKEIIEKTMKK